MCVLYCVASRRMSWLRRGWWRAQVGGFRSFQCLSMSRGFLSAMEYSVTISTATEYVRNECSHNHPVCVEKYFEPEVVLAGLYVLHRPSMMQESINVWHTGNGIQAASSSSIVPILNPRRSCTFYAGWPNKYGQNDWNPCH
jgi:hypothetical protein